MWLHREAWILFVVGPNGRIGAGEAVLEPDATEVEETLLARLMREAADRARAGEVPDVEELELLGTPGRAFRAALDAARFDLLPAGSVDPASAGTDPVTHAAGAARAGSMPGVPVNGTIGFGGPAAGAEAALQAIEAGFTTLKLKAGAERETLDLVARVRAIRVAVGPDVRLRLDVNGAWDLPTAEDRLEAVARFGIEYVEQPLPADDGAGAAELRRRVAVPIAADEAAASPAAVRRLLAEGAADVLVVKPARVGGPIAVAEIAEAAAAHDVPVVVSTLFETGIGIAAALMAAGQLRHVPGARFPAPLAHGLATAGLLEHDLLDQPLIVEAGRMHAPGGDGTGRLGITVNRRSVARFAAEFVEAAP
jgi:L-alanine-DL-glutamate epimerase-like enolase superfamily enzyme